ncbi:MAG: DUF21 domain-containing protein [Desulfobulbaceae bacterium]|nr:DUF21 domain-containing protein [Desulfobulbaceae bacterium]
MLIELCLAVAFAIIVSFLSSLTEAALYSISTSQVEVLAGSGRRSGAILKELKADINKPITAILTINTIANTMGAAIVGAAAAELFGDHTLGVFSFILTLAILVFSEIIPKTLGVSYCQELMPWIAHPLMALVKIFTPLVWLSNHLTRLIEKPGQQSFITAKEIQVIAALSKKSGGITRQEEKIIVNILELKHKTVRKAMTPRTVVFSLNANLTVNEAVLQPEWNFHSRVPVYDKDQGDIVGVVLRNDVLVKIAEGKIDVKLSDLMEPPHFVPESVALPNVLLEFIEHRQHLFVVVDEYGGLTGIISLEDIIEEIMGEEIMDESDRTQDMRALARFRKMTAAAMAESQKHIRPAKK